ncbi:hypothetical protein KUTeg_007926 [Tegillarca granosa]|uniref:Uncharacterized protein n=1 Tax=Tegillarca granosa TaxID=220873 RepID=A0ABQ9FHX5_TEGGR|nr:hypothetical protein KUTeg_007926 [Tegillarca granosa]
MSTKSPSSTQIQSGNGTGSQIPTPSTTSIPKPSSGKSSKSSKEDKVKGQSSKPQYSSSSLSSAQKSSGASSSAKSMQNHEGANTLPLPHNHSHNQSKSSSQNIEHNIDQSKLSSQVDDKMQQQHKTRYTEIEYSDGRIERIGEGHYTKPAHLALNQMQMAKPGSQNIAYAKNVSTADTRMMSQTVNIVKPTCSVANTSVSNANRIERNTHAHENTPQQISMLNRAIPPPLPTTEPPPRSTHRENSSHSIASPTKSSANNSNSNSNSDSTPSSSSHSGQSGNSGSSSESVIFRPSGDEYSGSEKGSVTNSPRLAVKLGSQINKPANNVAIVQPRHGEKMETTFDTEIRTETINKINEDQKNPKQTTFSEKETTFVDDSGETMDIKPMPPILRAMPYSGTGYLRGYGTPVGKIFHNPGYATPTTAAYYASTSRIGMNRNIMDHAKFSSGPIKKTFSSGSSNPLDTDYSSDYDTYDYISGYMSDGDILKSNKVDDMSSGYLSEGGASLICQATTSNGFREGMQAVKESMQKSSGLMDDDSFDDSSSISSGDISDTINEISTDEGNLTGGSSQSDRTNPYSSLKRTPQTVRNIANGNFGAPFPGKRGPTLGTSAFLGTDYSGDSGPISGWRKYSLPQTNRLLSSDPADYAYLYNGYDHSQWRGNQSNVGALRKLSNASQPEIHHYRGHSAEYAESDRGCYSPATVSQKRDSETNTDQSHLLETSMRRMQNAPRPTSAGSAPGQVTYGYRRPLSNASSSSVGSNKSSGSGSTKSSTAVGSRLAKHGVVCDSNGQNNKQGLENGHGSGNTSIPRPGSASAIRCTTPNHNKSDMGPGSL